MINKKNLIKELKFCRTLLDKLIEYAEDNYEEKGYVRRHTIIQNDIVRLRRELNDIKLKLNWDYRGI